MLAPDYAEAEQRVGNHRCVSSDYRREHNAGADPLVDGALLFAKRVIHLTQAAEDQHWGTHTGRSARVEPRAGTDPRAAAHSAPTMSPQPLPGLNLIQMDSPLREKRARGWVRSTPARIIELRGTMA